METLIKKINDSTQLIYSEVYKKLCIKKKIEEQNQAYFEQLKQISAPFMSKVLETTPNYVMFEYIEGNTLDQYITLYGKLDSKTQNNILLNICECLLILHNNNFIHRDIKPQNIVVSENGAGYLIDFNAMREVKQMKEQDTELLGTRGYASPEHYGFTETDKRSDIYSLGVVIRYCVEGNDNYPLYENLINKCTQVDPNNRYQDIDEIINILKVMEMKRISEEKEDQMAEETARLKRVADVNIIGNLEHSEFIEGKPTIKGSSVMESNVDKASDDKSVILIDKIILGIVFGITAIIALFLTYVLFVMEPNADFSSVVFEKVAAGFFLISLLTIIPGGILLISYFVLKITVKRTKLLRWFLIYLGVGISSIILSIILIIINFALQ